MNAKQLITWGVPIATLVIVYMIYRYTKPKTAAATTPAPIYDPATGQYIDQVGPADSVK